MITMKMQGGLGNQMFQFATGFAAAKRLGTELALDISSYAHDSLRQFNLDLFAIPMKVVFGAVPTVYEYGTLEYNPKLLKEISEYAVLSGYFQDERYFPNLRTELSNLFQPRKSLPFGYEGYLNKIQNSNSVALTIRRGDYLKKQEYHGVLEAQYYRDALKWMRHNTTLGMNGLDLFVFSDDIQWCKKNLMLSTILNSMTFIENDMTSAKHMGREDADIHLMKHCKGHIIANSSFSWWGAWLSDSFFVVAPSNWYAKPEIKHSIIPERWHTI